MVVSGGLGKGKLFAETRPCGVGVGRRTAESLLPCARRLGVLPLGAPTLGLNPDRPQARRTSPRRPEADWGRVQFRDRVCLDTVSFAKRALASLGRTGGWSPPNRSILQQRIGREGFYSQGYCQGSCDVIKTRPRNPTSGCSFAPFPFLPEAPLLIALGFVEVGSPCT